MSKTSSKTKRAVIGKSRTPRSPELVLRDFALKFPGAREEFPWGDRVVKVNKKIFVFLGVSGGGLKMGAKLPMSAEMALELPFASPTRYGLGKSGWVTAAFDKGDKPPLDLLKSWIEESYRAVAPKKLFAKIPS